MLSQAKVRAKRKGLPFDITRDDLTVPARCPVLGIPLAVSTDGNPSDGSPSLDRLIPEEGYIRGNVIIVSNKANRIKSDASLDDLRAVVDFYELLLPETKRHRKDPA